MSGEGQVNLENADNLHSQMDGIDGRSDPGSSCPAGDRRSDDENVYKMDNRHRGKFIVINNKTFDPITGMKERLGTDEDALNFERTFGKLGFTVERHDDQKAIEMFRIMQKAGQEDHTDNDCIAVAVLSHGEQGVLYGVDGTITNEQLIGPIKNCKSLAGKPKLFFFQMNHGNELENAINVVHKDDGGAQQCKDLVGRIPKDADFVFFSSTVPGSWFVKALCEVLEDSSYNGYEFLRMMTRVNKKVTQDVKSYCASWQLTSRKPLTSYVPSITSQLTKDLHLISKT